MSKASQLNAELGGTWKWYGFGGWKCDDGRHIRRYANCMCDDYCGHNSTYRLSPGWEDVTHLVAKQDLFSLGVKK